MVGGWLLRSRAGGVEVPRGPGRGGCSTAGAWCGRTADCYSQRPPAVCDTVTGPGTLCHTATSPGCPSQQRGQQAQLTCQSWWCLLPSTGRPSSCQCHLIPMQGQPLPPSAAPRGTKPDVYKWVPPCLPRVCSGFEGKWSPEGEPCLVTTPSTVPLARAGPGGKAPPSGQTCSIRFTAASYSKVMHETSSKAHPRPAAFCFLWCLLALWSFAPAGVSSVCFT